MSTPHEDLIVRFYSAFQRGDYRTMQACYHHEATFHDPVFMSLNAEQTKAMWQMLLTAARDLTITFSNVEANGNMGSAHWEAWYTFSRSGRNVHNVIETTMHFLDGKIWHHQDEFDLWRWSRQALGTSGVLLGWTPWVQNKVRTTARRGLERFMRENSGATKSA